MLLKMPYFMENKNWYYFEKDPNKAVAGKYYLTELGKSIPEVVKSYEEYNYTIDNVSDDLGFEYDTLKELERQLRDKLTKEGKSQEEIEKEVYYLWHLEEKK